MKAKPNTYALFLAKWRDTIEAMELEPVERVALDDFIIAYWLDPMPPSIDAFPKQVKALALCFIKDIDAIKEYETNVAAAHIDALNKANAAKDRLYGSSGGGRGRKRGCTAKEAYDAIAVSASIAAAEDAHHHPDYDADFDD